MDKTWCSYCNKYTYQTTGGCIECGNITLNCKPDTATCNIEQDYLDPVEDYSDPTEPM